MQIKIIIICIFLRNANSFQHAHAADGFLKQPLFVVTIQHSERLRRAILVDLRAGNHFQQR
uniref:Uncharacterized protein n=1 Tax=Histophilus somni (strain 129Pt) TaxID=205914 RepID=Q0I2A6_HISS1